VEAFVLLRLFQECGFYIVEAGVCFGAVGWHLPRSSSQIHLPKRRLGCLKDAHEIQQFTKRQVQAQEKMSKSVTRSKPKAFEIGQASNKRRNICLVCLRFMCQVINAP
jgi:hypothetical protein